MLPGFLAEKITSIMPGLAWLRRPGARSKEDVFALQQRVQELQAAEIRYRELIDALPVMVYSVEPTPPYRAYFLSRGHETLGYSVEEWMASPPLWPQVLHPDDRDWVMRETEIALERRDVVDYEYRAISKSGEVRWLRDRGRFVFDDTGKPIAWQGYMMDITERRQLEAELRQSQKLEALGRLSGGIAHDFNNLLCVIGSYVDLLLEEFPTGVPAHDDLLEIRKTVGRGEALTNQLLTFSRRRTPEVKRIEVDAAICGAESMVRRLIGPEIELVVELGAGRATVELEGGQLDQVLVNLLVNAAEAMPGGGRISITTRLLTVGPRGSTEPNVPSGDYVGLQVTDTGIGMDRETAARALEPFFTTKQARHGTGLGLSTVYGIAKHAGGGISIQSALGAGTTITVLLPRGSEALAAVEPSPARPPASVDTPARARILVVDDEDGVRVTLGRMLARRGYDVVTASSGSEALRAWESTAGGFAAVITDIRMPGMSGHELVQRFRAQKPDLPIVLMSGYADDPLTIPGVSRGPVRFFSKPLRLQDIVTSVSEVLVGQA